MLDQHFSDVEINDGIKAGNHEVFEFLFKKYYTSLLKYAVLIIKNPFLAEEIVQETFLKLWENHSKIEIRISVKAYLYRIIHNSCINLIKNLKIKTKLTDEAIQEIKAHADLALQNFSEDLLEQLSVNEMEVKLNGIIDNLPSQRRIIFLLSRTEDMSYSEIAKKLNISINTVKTQMVRALDRLREEYKKK